MPEYADILNAFTTLFVVIDPPGLLPTFLAITAGMNQFERKSVALRGVIIGFCLLVSSALAGIAVLNTMGITIPAFRVAGGLLLFYISFEMIFEKRVPRQEESSKAMITRDDIVNIAVFPLAIPLIAGPGALSATILLADQFGTSALGYAVLIAVLVSILVILFVTFILANRIEKIIGLTGRTILTRLMGVLLAALSVQFVADGVMALVASG